MLYQFEEAPVRKRAALFGGAGQRAGMEVATFIITDDRGIYSAFPWIRGSLLLHRQTCTSSAAILWLYVNPEFRSVLAQNLSPPSDPPSLRERTDV